MAISKIGQESFLRSVASPLNVGFGAMSYGMGSSSAGGAALGTAAQVGMGKLMHYAKPIFKRLPFGKQLGWLADIYGSMKAYSAGESIGNKVAPISWSKNHLQQVGEEN